MLYPFFDGVANTLIINYLKFGRKLCDGVRKVYDVFV